MKVFNERVQHTLTESNINILQCENYEEIFFGVFEVELNGQRYPVEKVSEYKGNPVVHIPIQVEGNEVLYPFVLCKGTSEILFNEQNVDLPVDELIYEAIDEVEIISESKQEILEQIERAKEDAKAALREYNLSKSLELSNKTKKNSQKLQSILEDARENLVDEFVLISEKLKQEFSQNSSAIYSELKESVDNRISDISIELSDSLNVNFDKSVEVFDSKIKKIISELYSSSVLPKVENDLNEIALQIVERIDFIENGLIDRLKDKVDLAMVESFAVEVDTIRKSNIELNDNFKKGLNKALSRVGNVNVVVENLEKNVNQRVDESIAKINILLEKLQSEGDQYILEEKSTKKEFGANKKDLDKFIHDKFETYKVELRKYATSYGGGGGSVAQQFADGGTINGNLIINGSIQANDYIGLSGGSDVTGLSANWETAYITLSTKAGLVDNNTFTGINIFEGDSQFVNIGMYGGAIDFVGGGPVSDFTINPNFIDGDALFGGINTNTGNALFRSLGLLGQTLTGSTATNLLDLSTTWNTTGNPSLIYGRVTNTASGANSNLIDLGTIAGGSLFAVTKTGRIGGSTWGLEIGPSFARVGAAGSHYSLFIPQGGQNLTGVVQVQSTMGIGWASSGSADFVDSDVVLRRDAANILAQRNGLSAQTFRLYNTYTDASNYERGFMRWNSNVLEIGTEYSGTGLARGILFDASPRVAALSIGTTYNTLKFTGHLQANTDNIYDIGASGANRPRSIFVGTNGNFGGALTVGNSANIGSGQYLTGSQATNTLELSPAWNTTGNPSLIYGRVTNTASGATANLIDLGTVAGGSQFKVDKAGKIFLGNSAPLNNGATIETGNYDLIVKRAHDSSYMLHVEAIGAYIGGRLGIGNMYYANNPSVFICWDAANTLGQRNGTNAQTSRLYTTFTARGAGTTSLEALEMKGIAAGSFVIQSLKGSAGGTARDIEFRHGATDTNGTITNGTQVARITPQGFAVIPLSSSTPAVNGDLTFEATSNTVLTVKFKGSDGTVRSATLALI